MGIILGLFAMYTGIVTELWIVSIIWDDCDD